MRQGTKATDSSALQRKYHVADLDLLRNIAHRSGRVFKQDLRLGGTHQAEKPAGLGAVVVIVLAVIPVVRRPRKLQGRR